MASPGSALCPTVLSSEEYESISEIVRNKIETFVRKVSEERVVTTALLETNKLNAEQLVSTLEHKIGEKEIECQDLKTKLDSTVQELDDIKGKWQVLQSESTTLKEQIARLESENNAFRLQRNSAVDERDDLMKIVERRNSEMNHLQEDYRLLSSQLQSAIAAKCEALVKSEEIETHRLDLDFKEKRMEGERERMTREIESLTAELNRVTEEISNLRRENTTRRLTLEGQLNEKIEDFKIAQQTIEGLQHSNALLEEKLEDSLRKLMAEHETSMKLQKTFEEELMQQTKLAELYRGMSDDATSKSEQLEKGIKELQNMIREAAEQNEKAEVQMKLLQDEHKRKLDEETERVVKLRSELQSANDLIDVVRQDKKLEMVEELSPAAASVLQLFNSRMTLTQIYMEMKNMSQELIKEKQENKRLNDNLDDILQQIQAKAPALVKLQEDHSSLLEDRDQLCQTLDIISKEINMLNAEVKDVTKLKDQYERETERLKKEMYDLSRQVCFLVKENQDIRCSHQDVEELDDLDEEVQELDDPMRASQVISQHLVTFSSIQELQSNNKKLLALVRELSENAERQEENGTGGESYDEMKALLEIRTREVDEYKEKQGRYSRMMERAMQQMEYFKNRMQPNGVGDDSRMDDDPHASKSSDKHSSFSSAVTAPCDIHDEEIKELNEKLQKTEKDLEELQGEFDVYRTERQTNEHVLTEQIDAMRDELRGLRTNCNKMTSQLEYSEERFKIMQANCNTYKTQIAALEGKNKNYNTTIVKQEQTLNFLQDELINTQKKLSRAEVAYESARRDVSLLKDAEARLQREREAFQREQHGQAAVLANLDSLRVSLERSEVESRARLESRLDESLRECAALRRRLQEEQDRFRELSNHLERQTESAKTRLEEEKQLVSRYKEELDAAKDELAKAKSSIDDLNKRVGDSGPTIVRVEKSDYEFLALEKQVKELQIKLRCMETELKGTQDQLTVEKEHSKQFADVSESLEVKLTDIMEEYNNYKITSEKRITEFMHTEEELMKKISALESKLSSVQTGSNQSSAQLSIQLQKTQEDLQTAQEELDKAKHDLTNARMEVASLSASVQAAEDKYAHEIVMHSTDVQNLLTVKKELSEVSSEVKELRASKATAEQALEQGRESWEEREGNLQKELTETQKRIADLDSHNAKLHEQLEELTSKIAIIQAQGVQPSPNNSLTEDAANKSVNASLCEDEIKSSDQLMQIIKYLRKEKNVAISRYDVLKAENLRLTSQLECIKKQLEDAKSALDAEKEKSDVTALTTSKHAELLRKLETLSAITDSNRMLRSERDTFQAQAKELQLRVESLEQELSPLREENRDCSARLDSLDAENTALRTETGRLRQRVNFLIERSSKTSPEDWRRLQQERETLARQVSADREALQRKDEEARNLRQEKTRLEEQINAMTRQQQQQAEELKRQGEELNTVQQRLNRITQELGESKTLCTKRNDELAKITEDLGAKEAMLTDARNKEFQIRKIAKKYKTQFEELTKTSEDDKKKIEELTKSLSDAQAAVTAAQNVEIAQEAQEQLREEGRREVELRMVDVETRHTDRVKELVGQVTSSHDEAETLRKENDSLKNSANEKEERAKAVLKTARQKIMQLTESNKTMQQELEETKGRLQVAEQGKEEDTVRMNALKSQYENRIARLEKENSDLRTEKVLELESLNQRVSQLQRQLEKYQGSKPSTSSGTGDKSGGEPPTANIKPMAGPSSTGVKQTQSQQSVTVTPWAGRGDTPFASIRPMSLQSRTAAVLPTSQSASSTLSPATPVLVPPQQQLVHTTGSGSGSGPEGLSSSPTSSHTDYIPMPATSSASSGSSVVRQVAVPPTVTTVSPSSREEPPQSAQSVAESTQDMEAEPAIADASPQTGISQQQQQQHRQQPDHVSQHKVEPQLQQQQGQQPPQPPQQSQQPQQQQSLPQSQATAGPSQQITQTVAPSAPQQGQAVAMVLPRVEQQPLVPAVSGQGQQVEQAAAAPSSQASSSSNTVTTSQAGVGNKRARDAESEAADEDVKTQGKRSRLAGSGQQDMFPASSDSVLEVEYQVPTSSQRDQEDEMVDSEEDEEGIADEGVIEEADECHEFDDDETVPGYEVEGDFGTEQDLTSFEEVEGPDIDVENPADQENNEAEIMDDSNEVPNQSGTDSPARPVGEPTSRPPSAPQQHAEASSSGTSSSGGTEVGSACATGVGTSRVASSGVVFGRGPARSVPPLTRQQQQQNQLLLGYEESGDDSIVPSTPTLFVPRRSDGFGEAVSSPQVPQTRFTFSDANTPATRAVSQGTSESIDDSRMDLNQLEEAGTGRSVPTTPPQVSPQEMSSEVGQSEGGSEEALPQSEEQPEASGSQTSVPSITVTEASEEDTGDAGEEMPPPEVSEYDESTEQRDTSGEQEQEESLELADEGGDGVSSEGEKSQPLEDVEEGREAEATEAPEAQESPRRVTRAANTARRSVRNPFRTGRGRGNMRPTPIIWNEPGSSMGNPPPRGRALLMQSMRGSPNFTRGSQRGRRPRGKPKGNFSSPYQMRF